MEISLAHSGIARLVVGLVPISIEKVFDTSAVYILPMTKLRTLEHLRKC